MSLDNAETHLKNVIIPYWNSLKDEKYGGFYGYKGYDLTVDKQADKGVILHSRILWFYASAYMTLGDESLRSYADHAYAFLRDHAFDKENGGIFWMLTYDGKPADTTKNAYNQAFGIYALSAYYRATGCREALRLAYHLFECIEAYCTDAAGYLEAFTADWKTPVESAICDQGVVADKSMNTLLHLVEGYSGLLAADPESRAVAAALTRLLTIATDKMYNPRLRRIETFFDADLNNLADIHSYGHDAESSWLLDWAADVLEAAVKAGAPLTSAEKSLALSAVQKTHAITGELARCVLEKAFDGRALNLESRGEAAGHEVMNTERVWWVEAEAVVGFVNAWKKADAAPAFESGALKADEASAFKTAAEAVYAYIMDVVVDKRPGSEWFSSVSEDGEPLEKPITEPWKCPYHNGRMCLELIRRLG